jgi:putative ABC transport system permease protein
MIGAPLAYLLIKQWLNSFAYNTGINVFVFIGAGALTLAIAMATISYNTIRAANMNPVESLRSE